METIRLWRETIKVFIITKHFKRKGIVVSFFTFGTESCSLSDLSLLVKETQGIMGRNEFPLTTPIITLPVPIQEISDIKITVIADRRIILSAFSDSNSKIERDGSTLINKRNVVITSSIFCFNYELRPNSIQRPNQIYPIQVKIEYCKGDALWRRTATSYVLLLNSQPPYVFTEYDVLIKYGAKASLYFVDSRNEDKKKERIAAQLLLNHMIKMLEKSQTKNGKINVCIHRLRAHIDTIRNGQNDDTEISRRIEEVTTDCYKENL